MTRRPVLLTLSGIGLGLSLLQCGLIVWGVTSSYEWDLARCRSLPDHYAPELFWLILGTPPSLVGLLFMITAVLMAVWGQPNQRRLPWISLGIGMVIVGATLTLSGLAIFGPCPVSY